jgi:glycosyltransferase involved in cell wall biosynthesis
MIMSQNNAKGPLVSIGVPTYNRPKTLRKTLESLVNQSYSNLEIVVSDNGSTDGDVDKIMAEFCHDNRVKYFKQPTNRGAIFNFNFVLEKFTGSYCMRIGDDDWLDGNYIELCLKTLTENLDYICAYGRTKLFTLQGEFLKNDAELSLDQDSYYDRIIHYYTYVTQNGPYFGLIRIEAANCLQGKVKYAEDWLGVARICFMGKVKMLEETSLNLSLGGVGSSASNIVKSFGLSKFDLYFPHASIAINVFMDICFYNKVYRKIGLLKRLSLAIKCVKVLYKRFGIKMEIMNGYKAFLKGIIRPGIN